MPVKSDKRLSAQKFAISYQLLLVIACVLLPISMMNIYHGFTYGFNKYDALQLLSIIIVWIVAFTGFLKNANTQACFVIAILLTATLSEVYRSGVTAVSLYMLTIVPVFTTVIFGTRKGLVMLGAILAVTSIIAFDWIFQQHQLPANLPSVFYGKFEWFSHLSNLAIAAAVGIIVTGRLNQFNERANTSLEKANEQLLQSVNRLHEVAKIAELGYATTCVDSHSYIECDEAFAAMHGKTVDEIMLLSIDNDVIGSMLLESARLPAQQDRVRFIQGDNIDCVYGYRLKNDEIRYLRKMIVHQQVPACSKKLAYIICQDVTKPHLLQEKLFKSQRLESIGKLAGGAAHDFNNLLAVISGNLELLRHEVDNDEQPHKLTHERLDNCINAALRGSTLTKCMLSFAREAPLEPSTFQLNQTVSDLNAWISSTLPANIKMHLSLDEHLWKIKADRNSTESAILNLVLNACHAMPDGGQLTLKTSNQLVEQSAARRDENLLSKGRYAVLKIRDTGSGIASEHLNQIFEPFFSTKPANSGSGLGLSMVLGFMEQSGGSVHVDSPPGMGTTFSLYFPVSQSSMQTEQERNTLPKHRTAEMHQILVVEDSAEILDILSIALRNNGYEIVTASSADEALSCYEKNQNKFDLLITDISMPGILQGTSLAVALREYNPHLPVIYVSGFSTPGSSVESSPQTVDIRLAKPFRIEELLAAVENAYRQAHGNATNDIPDPELNPGE